MATVTCGTKATTTFGNALQSAGPGSAGLPAAADIATLNNLIVDDQSPALANGSGNPGTVSANMQVLYVPNRGFLTIMPGDWVGVSPAGFPYLIPAIDMATTTTATGTANSTTTITFTVNVKSQGWVIGGLVTGTNIPASTTITNIAADGKSITISNAATGSGANTVTYGSWAHS